MLYAKGYLYPMSPGLLKVADDDDDDIVEMFTSYHYECKKSCLNKGYEW